MACNTYSSKCAVVLLAINSIVSITHALDVWNAVSELTKSHDIRANSHASVQADGVLDEDGRADVLMQEEDGAALAIDASTGRLSTLRDHAPLTRLSAKAVADLADHRAHAFLNEMLASTVAETQQKDASIKAALLKEDPKFEVVEQMMVNAATKEASNTRDAKAAAQRMTQATLTRVNEILEKVNNEIATVEANAMKDFAAQKTNSATISKDELESHHSYQEAVKHDTEAAAMKLKTSAQQPEIIEATAMSEAAIQRAFAESEKIKASLPKASSKLNGMVERAQALAQKATTTIHNVMAQAKADVDALASQLGDVGVKTATKMKAADGADAIVLLTSDAVAQMRDKAAAFVEAATAKADNVQASGDQTVKAIVDIAAATKTQGEDVATRLEDGARDAKGTMNLAKKAWVESGVKAVTMVDSAASEEGAINHATDEKPVEAGDSARTDSPTRNHLTTSTSMMAAKWHILGIVASLITAAFLAVTMKEKMAS